MTEIRVTNNMDKFTDEMEERLRLAFEQMAEDTKRYSQMKVPKKMGELRATAEVEHIGKFHYRVWYDRYNDLGYAAYQEAGVRFDDSHRVQNYTKASSGPHYLKNAGERIEKVAKKYIKVALARIKL